MKHRFVTFEGGEGTGKSTQLKRLAQHLSAMGIVVCATREPGGTPQAESLRDLVVNGQVDEWSAEAETLLMYAARDSHLNGVIRPALARGETVVCDRFMDSTRVYQGIAGGCPLALIDALEASIVAATVPDCTLVFDLAPEIGLARAAARSSGHEQRFEGKGLEFHRRLRAGFLTVASAAPQRSRIIDASQSEDAVFEQILAALGLPNG